MLDLREGSFQTVLSDVQDVDLILTDPPYPYKFIDVWSDLGAWAAQALKPGALLVAYSGQYWLGGRRAVKTHPAERGVVQRLAEHLEFVVMTWLSTPGANVAVHQVPVMSGGKPILFYARPGTYDGPLREVPPAEVVSPRRTREMHKWEQHLIPARELVERYSEPGDLVAEPFLGSGTFALAALQAGRRVVGAELDPVAYATSVDRVTSPFR